MPKLVAGWGGGDQDPRVDSARFEPGVRLSGHLISAEIGAGGFSRVYRAEPVGGGPAVAIKVAVRGELVSALRAEGAVLRRLQGPRFVKILEEHLEEDPPYFVLELCEGGDLRAHADRAPGKRVPPEVVQGLMVGVLEGCAFAHDEGVVHGDLKPENILLAGADGPLEPKIADLGLSRAHRQRLLAGRASLEQSLGTADESRIRGTASSRLSEDRLQARLALWIALGLRYALAGSSGAAILGGWGRSGRYGLRRHGERVLGRDRQGAWVVKAARGHRWVGRKRPWNGFGDRRAGALRHRSS